MGLLCQHGVTLHHLIHLVFKLYKKYKLSFKHVFKLLDGKCMNQGLDPLIFIADPFILSWIWDPESGSFYFYRRSWIPDLDPFILSWILDPDPLILSWIRILLIYCGSGTRLFLSWIQRGIDIMAP
jgi:hypothetical protein